MKIIKSSIQHPEVEYWYITNGGYHNNLDLYFGKFKNEDLWFTYNPEDSEWLLWFDESTLKDWIDFLYGIGKYESELFEPYDSDTYYSLYHQSVDMDDEHIEAAAHEIYEIDEDGNVDGYAPTRGHQANYD